MNTLHKTASKIKAEYSIQQSLSNTILSNTIKLLYMGSDSYYRYHNYHVAAQNIINVFPLSGSRQFLL